MAHDDPKILPENVPTSDEGEEPLVKPNQPIRDFDPKRDIPEPTFRAAIFGKTCSGKSHGMRYILSQIKNRFDYCYLFSKTADLQKETYSYVHESNKFNFLDFDFIEKVMQTQRRDFISGKKMKRVLMIFDDLISDSDLRKNDIATLFVAGRHTNISCIATSQVVGSHMSLSPAIRNNCELIMSFSLFSEPDRKILIERFGSVETKNIGTNFFKYLTQEKYQACVFCTHYTDARKSCEYMLRFKADPKIPNFKIGKSLQEYNKDELLNIDVRIGNMNEPVQKKNTKSGGLSLSITMVDEIDDKYLNF